MLAAILVLRAGIARQRGRDLGDEDLGRLRQSQHPCALVNSDAMDRLLGKLHLAGAGRSG
jgi:hypothetical protein